MTTTLTITGAAARELVRDARGTATSRHFWTEMQVMRECRYGCKLHVSGAGAVSTYTWALIHYAGYGCPQGRDTATAVVPVAVRPSKP